MIFCRLYRSRKGGNSCATQDDSQARKAVIIVEVTILLRHSNYLLSASCSTQIAFSWFSALFVLDVSGIPAADCEMDQRYAGDLWSDLNNINEHWGDFFKASSVAVMLRIELVRFNSMYPSLYVC